MEHLFLVFLYPSSQDSAKTIIFFFIVRYLFGTRWYSHSIKWLGWHIRCWCLLSVDTFDAGVSSRLTHSMLVSPLGWHIRCWCLLSVDTFDAGVSSRLTHSMLVSPLGWHIRCWYLLSVDTFDAGVSSRLTHSMLVSPLLNTTYWHMWIALIFLQLSCVASDIVFNLMKAFRIW